MTLAKLDSMKAGLKARDVDVESLVASDLFSPDVDRETKNALSLDLLRRQCEKRAATPAAK